LADILSQCLLCGACKATCPRGVDIPGLILTARTDLPTLAGGHPFLKLLARKVLANPALLPGLARTAALVDREVVQRLPADSGLRLRLGLLCQAAPPATAMPASSRPQKAAKTDDLKPAAVAYFAGCQASHLDPGIAHAVNRLTTRLLGSATLQPPGQTCCGLASHSAGASKEARRLARANIEAFADNVLPILTSCASCYAHLMSYPELFSKDDPWRLRAEEFSGRVREFSTLINVALPPAITKPSNSPAPAKRVFYHDPCHLRFDPKITAEPRQLLARLPGVTIAELPGGPQCCGQGGLFHLSYPNLAAEIGQRLLTSFAATNADLVTSTCSGCLLQWQRLTKTAGPPVEVLHLAVLVDRSLP
jgi:glycolate oxidase iron-sulfur subunit